MAIRILVVGSSRQNVDLARKALTPLGCEVSPATSIALGLFLAHKTLPDLILSDIRMVDGTGLDFIREVKADEELRSIPFIFLATGQDQFHRAQYLASGAEKFISHPLTPQAFLGKVEPYLNERRQRRPEESPE